MGLVRRELDIGEPTMPRKRPVLQLWLYSARTYDNDAYDESYSSITPQDIREYNRYFQWFVYYLTSAYKHCQPMKCAINNIEYRPETLFKIIHRIQYKEFHRSTNQ